MMAIKYSTERTIMVLPFIGEVNLGLLYAFAFVPLAIIFAANAVNILEGYNGLGSGMGIIMSFGLIVIT